MAQDKNHRDKDTQFGWPTYKEEQQMPSK